jgi:hypothetical protein
MLVRRVFVLAGVLMVSACTTTEKMSWVGVGGSKADGTVVLGIEVPAKVGIAETHIEWDMAQANSEANKRCQNWGYAGAEVFNDQVPVLRVCHPMGLSPCWSKSYRLNYQCIDKK